MNGLLQAFRYLSKEMKRYANEQTNTGHDYGKNMLQQILWKQVGELGKKLTYPQQDCLVEPRNASKIITEHLVCNLSDGTYFLFSSCNCGMQ